MYRPFAFFAVEKKDLRPKAEQEDDPLGREGLRSISTFRPGGIQRG